MAGDVVGISAGCGVFARGAGPRVAGWWVVLLLSTVGAAAPGLAEQSAPVLISGSGWIADAPTKVAEQQGYFDPSRDGLPIDVVYDDSGKASLQRLLAGEADYALAATTPVALALLEQHSRATSPQDELVILAAIALSNRSHYLIAHADRIRRPADLDGRRVGVVHDTSADFGWDLFSNFHGLGPSAVTRVDGSTDELAALMLAGELDAVMAWDPWGQRVVDSLAERAIIFETRQLHTVNWLLVSTRGQLARHPEVATRILSGYRQAIELIEADPVGARQLHARVTDQSVELLETLEEGVVWGVRLNWSVLANMELQMGWFQARRPDLSGPIPTPNTYLDAAPLSVVAPEWVMLPSYLHGSALP